MKKNLIAAFITATVLIASCSKEKAAEPELKDEALYPVTFNVNTFKTEVVPMATAPKLKKLSYQGNGLGGPSFQSTGIGEDWLGNKMEYLEYYVFNESGARVNHISQWPFEGDGTQTSVRNEQFGKFEDTLPAGKYKVVFKSGYGTLNGDFQYAAYTNIDQDRDAFGNAFDIIIADKALEQSVELDRIVGKLEVKLLDKIPNDIDRIVLSINGISNFHYIYGGRYGTNDKSEKTISTTSSNFESQLFLYFGYQGYETSSGHATVNIRAYGTEGNLAINKIINDVPVGVNKTTILSGKLFEEFGSSKGQGFSVSLKDNWLENDHKAF